MQRRDFVKSLAAMGITSALPMSALAQLGNSTAVNVKTLFNQALAKDPAYIGFANVEGDFAPKKLAIEGKIPTDLKGMFVRNGPAKHERGDQRYRHLFEGDGMVQQFQIADGNIVHQGKFLQTPKFVQEEKAGRFLFSGPDTRIKGSLGVSNADQVNVANTNIIPVNGDLWALWEGGSATEIDAESLAYKRQVNLGEGTSFGNQLKNLPFSAHPKIDPNGDIWNFGANSSGHIIVYHLSPKGRLKNMRLVPSNYKGGMLHDFLITKDYVLIVLPSLIRHRHKQGLFNSIGMDNKLPMQVLVLDKNTLEVAKQYELPPGFVFHFGNAWQDKQKNIHFDASLYSDVGVLHELSDVMLGKKVKHRTNAYTTWFTLHNNGQVSQHTFPEISEFPRVCNHLTGIQNRFLFHLSCKEHSLWSDSVVARDLQRDTTSQFEYGSDYLVEEHIPICPTGKEGKGYLIGTALHVPTKRTCLNIFNMTNVADGPIARAWLPYHLPLGFHGNFISA
ncbi:carotenoid oxygenase family protein [Thalassotalea euphylliae]|uniref:carotenoid oxygenase family protein n=1 Tax=Thalassotalea euphylliae TaxID=1655234 RepID=UPI00363AD646